MTAVLAARRLPGRATVRLLRAAAVSFAGVAVIVLFAPWRTIAAQDVGPRGALVDVSVQADSVKIGAPFTVRIRVRTDKSAVVKFPPPPDSADAIEAVDPRFIEDAPGTASTIDRTAVYRLVAWDVGTRTPRFGPVNISIGGSAQSFAVTVPSILVQSVLPADTTERIPRAVRDPSPEPSGLWRLWFILGVLAIGLLWYFWSRHNRRVVTVPVTDAFVTATTGFAALDDLGLIAAGEPARHVIASVDLLRSYLARRFPGAIESLTPTELDDVLAAVNAPVDRDALRELLLIDAALRFARAGVTADEAGALSSGARAIVRRVQDAYEEQLREEDRGPQRPKRR